MLLKALTDVNRRFRRTRKLRREGAIQLRNQVREVMREGDEVNKDGLRQASSLIDQITAWHEQRDEENDVQTGATAFADEVRAIMEGEESNNIMAADIIREVAQWHTKGRPDADTTIRRLSHKDHEWEPGVISGYAVWICSGCGQMEDRANSGEAEMPDQLAAEYEDRQDRLHREMSESIASSSSR